MAQDSEFFSGMEVRDANDDSIGELVRYDSALGYFETAGPFGGSRYIPLYAVEGVSPTAIRLNVSREVVNEAYRHLPKIRPELDESGRLTGGATVESGDGGAKRVPLDAEAISGLRDRIHEGTPVFDDAEQKVGFVEGYDRETGYMHLKEGVVLQQDVFLPATTVAFLDDRGIHLAVTKQAIMDRFTRIPDIARHVFAP